MERLPFSVYDFFGYMACGFALMAGLAAAFVGDDRWQKSPNAVVALVLVVAAYSVGHVIANIAGFVLEAKLVGSVLGPPSSVLFHETGASGWRRIFPGYHRALPLELRKRILDSARSSGIQRPGVALFFHCFATVKSDERTMLRLDTFLNLYGFARNMCVALVCVSIVLTVGSLIGTAQTGPLVPPGWWAAGTAAAAIGLLYRYLKFFRHYAVEVFITYAEGNRKAT